MSSIDWSDPDEMVGLLIEYVNDEATASHDDERVDFLRQLASDLENLAAQEFTSVEQMAGAMRETREAQPSEFLGDDVMMHVDACIEELQRIGSESRQSGR